MTHTQCLMKIKFALFFLFFCATIQAQNNSVVDLRNNILKNTYVNKQNLFIKDSFNNLNYAKLLINSWKCLDDNTVVNNDWGTLSQAFSFLGDNINVINTSINHLQTLGQLEILKDTNFINSIKENKIDFNNSRKLIIDEFKHNQIVMFNEAHDRVQTRAYFLSLLSDLKKAGATCLALETLNESGNLKVVDKTTGYYSSEPVCAQIIREAIRLGFRLIPYEDTIGYKHTNNQRDSIQAENLYNRIKTKNGIEKTVVLAGYGHIAEDTFSPEFKSMAMYFQSISKINPLTVNQCEFIEESYMSTLSKKVVDIIYNPDSVFAITKEYVKGVIFNEPLYDIYIYHPTTKYIRNRPNWLLSPEKKLVQIPIPNNLKPVLIQTYVSCEIKTNEDYNMFIPYDQTFYSVNDCADLILKKNTKYKVVFRNSLNEIIRTSEYNSK